MNPELTEGGTHLGVLFCWGHYSHKKNINIYIYIFIYLNIHRYIYIYTYLKNT